MDPRRREQSQERRAARDITKGIEERIEQLHQLSARKRILEVLPFAGLYAIGAFMAWLAPSTPWLTLPAILLMGLALNSLGILIHEGLHGLLARDPRANHFFGFLCGAPLLLSATAYQVTHCDHHFELGRKLDYGTYKQHLGKRHLVWMAYFAQLFLGSIIYILFIPVLAFKVADARTRFFILFEYAVIGGLVMLLFTFVPSTTILLYWVYPGLVLMALSNIRGLASHALGDLDDIYLSSRTIPSSRLVSFLFLHENYHLEHHLFPRVPSYHLKAAHALIWHRLPRALYSKSYLEFLRAFFGAARNLDLKPSGHTHPVHSAINENRA